MPEVDQLPVIKRLPSQLANQIAAGEVIERPASVLKELIENALDANASRINIELVNGGMEHIVVTDDGHGIHANELPLAISRHATSKIDCVDDLLNLQSLGFRGEALASICSVSQWEMISKAHAAKHATKLSYLMPDEMLEINHATGTRVSIKQLFYNTPARRKFLRAERTEYRHCEDVIKRMALARFDVAFYAKHNGRQTLKLPAVSEDIGRSRRVALICGEAFIKQSVVIDYPRNDMRLWGWVSRADYSRQTTDLQYFYINGRIIRDRVINHAIRLAYQHVLPVGRHAAYVLHLDLDPATVDVNVHPTKHEVRFRESRIIHDFISRSIRDAIQQVLPNYAAYSDHSPYQSLYTDPGITEEHLQSQNVREQQALYQQPTETQFGVVLTIIKERFAITQQQQRLFLVDLQRVIAYWVSSQWSQAAEEKEIKSLPLLIPQRLSLTSQEVDIFKQNEELFVLLGFELNLIGQEDLLIRKIPSLVSYYESISLAQHLLTTTYENNLLSKYLNNILSDLAPDYKKLDLNIIFNAMASSHDQSRDEYAAYWREITSSDLNEWLDK